jgi:hypothetical protein
MEDDNPEMWDNQYEPGPKRRGGGRVFDTAQLDVKKKNRFRMWG